MDDVLILNIIQADKISGQTNCIIVCVEVHTISKYEKDIVLAPALFLTDQPPLFVDCICISDTFSMPEVIDWNDRSVSQASNKICRFHAKFKATGETQFLKSPNRFPARRVTGLESPFKGLA